MGAVQQTAVSVSGTTKREEKGVESRKEGRRMQVKSWKRRLRLWLEKNGRGQRQNGKICVRVHVPFSWEKIWRPFLYAQYAP